MAYAFGSPAGCDSFKNVGDYLRSSKMYLVDNGALVRVQQVVSLCERNGVREEVSAGEGGGGGRWEENG